MNIGISFLRSLACLMVFFSHSIYYSTIAPNIISPLPWWVTGFLGGSGVAIFFTLSGYLIIKIAYKTSPIDFICSRFIRIYPGYWLAIFIYFFIIKFNLDKFNFESFFLIPIYNNYNTYNIPAWSLFYEIQFYFLVFFLLILNRFIKIEFKILVYFLSLLWLIVIVINCYYININLNSQTPGIFIIFSSMNLLFIGGIFSDKFNFKFLINRNYINLIIGSILYFYSLYIEPASNRLYPNIILSLGGIFILNYFINLDYKFLKNFENFSEKSYGVYLIHLIIMDFVFTQLQIYGFKTEYQFIWFSILSIMTFVPCYYFGFIENKLHQKLKSIVRK